MRWFIYYGYHVEIDFHGLLNIIIIGFLWNVNHNVNLLLHNILDN